MSLLIAILENIATRLGKVETHVPVLEFDDLLPTTEYQSVGSPLLLFLASQGVVAEKYFADTSGHDLIDRDET